MNNSFGLPLFFNYPGSTDGSSISQTSSAEYTLKKKVFCNSGLQQVSPDAATALGQNGTPQVLAMQSNRHIDDVTQSLITNQSNNRNYLAV